MKDVREERFISKENEVNIIEPSCRTCKYAINYGVEGCKLDIQTDRIKFAIDICDKKEATS